jgi:hypothetical protein
MKPKLKKLFSLAICASGAFKTVSLIAIVGVLVVLTLSSAFASTVNENSIDSSQSEDSSNTPRRTRYEINLDLDFDARTFTGTERVRWTNDGERPVSILYFHLYANVRQPITALTRPLITTSGGDETAAPPQIAAQPQTATPPGVSALDEPRLEILEVRPAATREDNSNRPNALQEQRLFFALENDGTILRVLLGTPLSVGSTAEIEIRFRGSVPEIDTEETGLLAHVVRQIDAALSNTREARRARDINFRSRGTMLLGAAYPILAVRSDDGDWQRRIDPSVGRMIFAEAADYRVRINAPANVHLFTSGEEHERSADENASSISGQRQRTFTGERLREFAIIASRDVNVESRTVAGVRVQSIFTREHERTGRRALAIASDAVRIFSARFGALPYRVLTIAEVPLVAGMGRAEFSGLSVVASAYYVDFEQPTMRNLPQIVRDQRESLEDSLEWTIAQTVAYQWWGASVGGDPQRAPVLEGALSSWSALHYFREAHNEERARQISNDQLRGVYEIYRTLGGEDASANRSARDYRNSFQFAAIVHGKAALMFEHLRRMMPEERFWAALRRYYEANRFEVAELEDLRQSFVAEVPPAERRAVSRTFNRWLTERRGDEDVAPPNPQLVAAFGITPTDETNPTNTTTTESNSGRANRGNRFARFGRFFWRQMTRIR